MGADGGASGEAKPFTVKLTGEGLTFETSVSAQQVAAIMALALGATPVAPAGGGSALLNSVQVRPDDNLFVPGERLSLREFLDATEAKRLPEKILSIALYLEQHEQLSGFSRDDIKGRFRSAGEAPPGNFPRDFAVAVSSGWIAEDHANKGTFYVTKTGKAVVSARFAPDVTKTQRRSSRKRRPSKNAGGDSDE